jgi:integrase
METEETAEVKAAETPERRPRKRVARYQDLTRAELVALLRQVQALRDRALCLVVYKYGLRASEVGLLGRGDVELPKAEGETGTIAIRRLKGREGRRRRNLNGTPEPGSPAEPAVKRPLFADVAQALADYLATVPHLPPHAPLFPSRQGKPLGRTGIFRIVQAYAVKAGLPAGKRHPHALRHTVAMHLADAGRDLLTIQDHLGHRRVANTEVYVKMSAGRRQREYEEIERRGVLGDFRGITIARETDRADKNPRSPRRRR